MIDLFNTQMSFLLFEAVFCFLSALVYLVGRDPIRIRKHIVLSLNVSCGFMLIFEFLFYVYKGSTDPIDIVIMCIVNAAVYYLVLLMMFFYAMLVSVRIFGKFNLKPDMPCRKRLIAVTAIVSAGLVLITVSQFTGIYYYFDENHVYQRGPLFWLAALLPTLGAAIAATMIVQYRRRLSIAQRIVLASYLVLPLVGEVIQFLFFGNSLLNICLGLAVLLMFFENMVNKEKEIIKASKTEVRTGLANEHGYIQWLNSMKGNPDLMDYAAVFFDLRKFSDINRNYGVENGNRILAAFGNLLLSKVDEDEILGRQFGNKFIAIIRKKNLDKLVNVLQGVEVTFEDIRTETERKVILSSHIGVYMIDRTDLDGEDILIFAEQALSAAKANGTEEVVMLTQELIDSISDRKKLESEIRYGLQHGEFIPFYQPKVDIRTEKMCGAEALSRWNHDGTIVFPGTYISIMETDGMICELDFCILTAVCRDISEWLKDGIDIPVVSVNFSRRNLGDKDLAKHIDDVVSSSGIPKNLIEIEITESSDEFSIEDLNSFVDSLHALGYKVSIDDFGSASSSLTLLREVAFDTLKIDKGFIDHDKEKDQRILSYITRLAGDINMNIVAEGVEQKQQVEKLNDLGVNVIQGFYFDKPLSKEIMTNKLKSPNYPLEK